MTTTVFNGTFGTVSSYKPIQLVEVNMSNGDELMSMNENLDYAELCKKLREQESNGSGNPKQG